MGILKATGVSNPFSDWLDMHRNAVTQFGVGLANGRGLSEGIGLGTQGLAKGAEQDTAFATQQKTEADRQAKLADAVSRLQDKYPDLASALQSGVPMGDVFSEVWKRQSPDYQPKPLAPVEVNPGNTLYDPNTRQPMFTAPPDPTAHAPISYRFTPDGKSLEPIPGGPSDPNTASSLTPEALDLISTQYLAGDKSVISGYARNATMRATIANAIAAKAAAQGMDGRAIAAEVSAYGGNVAAQRSAGTRAAQVGMAASEANQMADIALDASKAVPRGSLTPWNQLTNAVATNTSSPEMAKFVTATTSLVNAYARAVSPLGAPTDAMRQHAEQMLNTAQGPDAYAAVIDQMKQEMTAALNAPAEISSSLKASITDGGPPAGGAAVPQGAPDLKTKYGLE